jgi:hypothetical protein
MAKLPVNVNATKLLLDGLRFPRRRGNSIGMGSIGDPCARRLWFGLHWAGEVEEITLRLSNLFETGTRAEEFMIADLKRIGIEVTSRQEELWGFMRHAHGFTDGRCKNVPEAPKTEHLLEMKTHNDKNFAQLVKLGVRKAYPKHYAQVQRYMKGTGLRRTLYIGYNKNTSEYYIERIRYDASFADDLVRKEREIILAPAVPTKQFERSWFECKWCDFQAQCHDGAALNKNCRTCDHSDLGDGGKWFCCVVENEQHELPKEVQLTGCHLHKQTKVD